MSQYPYPADEFDAPPAPGQSVGIHRERRSAWSKWGPYLVVVVICALLAYGLVVWFDSRTVRDEEPTAGGPAVTSTSTAPEETADESGSKTPSDTDTAGDEDPAEPTGEAETTGTEETPEGSESPTDTETTADLDRAVAIRVLNATRTSGLAATGVAKLQAAGWTGATAANYTGGAVNATVVWYKSDEFAAEADQVAADLGLAPPTLVPELAGPISVVLAGDFSR